MDGVLKPERHWVTLSCQVLGLHSSSWCARQVPHSLCGSCTFSIPSCICSSLPSLSSHVKARYLTWPCRIIPFFQLKRLFGGLYSHLLLRVEPSSCLGEVGLSLNLGIWVSPGMKVPLPLWLLIPIFDHWENFLTPKVKVQVCYCSFRQTIEQVKKAPILIVLWFSLWQNRRWRV